LSVLYVSIAVWAVLAADFADASLAFCVWLKNDGIAIAARMPRISITTRSSTSVKPASPAARLRMPSVIFSRRFSIWYLLAPCCLARAPWLYRGRRHSPRW